MRALKLASPAENPALVDGHASDRCARPPHGPAQSRNAQAAGGDGPHGSRRRPFRRLNAYRLQAIAWVLLALQLISLIIWAIGKAVSTPAHPLHLNAGFSPAGWLAVVLTFVLARVFAEGTLMREDLEGTV